MNILIYFVFEAVLIIFSGSPHDSKVPRGNTQPKNATVLYPETLNDYEDTKSFAEKLNGSENYWRNVYILKNPDLKEAPNLKKASLPTKHWITHLKEDVCLQNNQDFIEYLVELEEGKKCFLLVTPYSSKLWAMLAEQCTSEVARLINEIVQGENHPMPQKLMIQQMPEDLGSLKKEAKPKAFHDQTLVGAKLLETMKKKLNPDGEDLQKSFDSFTFVYLVPNRISLEDQTKKRVKNFFEELKMKKVDDMVIRIVPSKSMKEKWSNVTEKVRTNPKTLFIVIHDECHYAAGHGKITSEFLGFGKCIPDDCKSKKCKDSNCRKSECLSQDYHFENGEIIPNLFTVMVSATPYSFLVIPKVTSDHIINWKEMEGLTSYSK